MPPPGPPAREGLEIADVDRPFSRRAVLIAVALGVCALVAAVLLAVLDDGDDQASAGPDSYSRSALGHRGLVELLGGEGITVVRSQSESGRRAGSRALLFVAEPRLASSEQKQALTDLMAQAHQMVLVLPKRAGYRDTTHPAWIDETELLPEADADAVISGAGIDAHVVRVSATPRFESQLAEAFPVGAQVADLQLIAPDAKLRPIVYAPEGILVGRAEGADSVDVIVISDPDLIANHGLGKGENAAIALAAIQALRPPGGVVVVDETLHGHVATASLWRELFSFPLSLATASALLCLALLLWAAMGRFGKPQPAPRALAAGKRGLIENTAELTRHGGHAAYALERYLHATVQDVARAQHAPAQLGPVELRAWLLRAASARHVATDLTELERDVSALATSDKRPDAAARALAIATRIHRWRQEMIDGSAGDSRAS
jgi:hypothetical protein